MHDDIISLSERDPWMAVKLIQFVPNQAAYSGGENVILRGGNDLINRGQVLFFDFGEIEFDLEGAGRFVICGGSAAARLLQA